MRFVFKFCVRLSLVLFLHLVLSHDDIHSISNLNGASSFTKIGRIATGLSKGHLFSAFDIFEYLRQQEEFELNLKEKLSKACKEAGVKSNDERLQRIEHLARHARDYLERIKYAFNIRVTQNKAVSHNIHKRQAMAGVGIVGAIFDLCFSAYEETQIQALEEAARAERREVHVLADYVHKQDTAIEKNSENIERLKTASEEIVAAQNFLSKKLTINILLEEAEGMAEDWLARTMTWSDGLLALLQNRLDPALLHIPTVMAAFHRLAKAALKTNRRPVTTDIVEILNADLSWTYKAGRVTVTLHVDFAHQEFYNLYRYNQLPEIVSNGSLAFIIDEEGQYIATDKTHGTGAVLNLDDIISCKKYGDVYACDSMKVLRNDIGRTCLGELLNGNTVRALQQCRLSFLLSDAPHVQRLCHNAIALVTPRASNLRLSCLNGSESVVPVGPGSFRISSDCIVKVDRYTAEPYYELSVKHGNFLDVPHIVNITNALNFHLDSLQLRGALESLQNIHGPGRRDFSEVAEAVRSAESVAIGGNFMHIASPLLTVMLLVALVGAGWMCLRAWQRCGRRQRANPPAASGSTGGGTLTSASSEQPNRPLISDISTNNR